MDEVVETALRCSLQIVDHEREQLRAQLAAVTAERDELRQRIAGAPVGWRRTDGWGNVVVCATSPFPESIFTRVRLVIDDQETDHA